MQLTPSSKCKFLPQHVLGVEAIIEKKPEEIHDFRGIPYPVGVHKVLDGAEGKVVDLGCPERGSQLKLQISAPEGLGLCRVTICLTTVRNNNFAARRDRSKKCCA